MPWRTSGVLSQYKTVLLSDQEKRSDYVNVMLFSHELCNLSSVHGSLQREIWNCNSFDWSYAGFSHIEFHLNSFIQVFNPMTQNCWECILRRVWECMESCFVYCFEKRGIETSRKSRCSFCSWVRSANSLRFKGLSHFGPRFQAACRFLRTRMVSGALEPRGSKMDATNGRSLPCVTIVLSKGNFLNTFSRLHKCLFLHSTVVRAPFEFVVKIVCV